MDTYDFPAIALQGNPLQPNSNNNVQLMVEGNLMEDLNGNLLMLGPVPVQVHQSNLPMPPLYSDDAVPQLQQLDSHHLVDHHQHLHHHEHTIPHVVTSQPPPPLHPPPQSFNILDESVKELFYMEPTEEHHSRFSSSEEDKSQETGDSGEEGVKADPFSESCRIPIPGLCEGGMLDTRTFVRRRNERERARVRSVNEGFERLRRHLPPEFDPKERRLSKVETLKYAIQYIEHLQSLLDEDDEQ